MNKLKETLESRKAVYGPYREGCIIRMELMDIIKDAYRQFHKEDMPKIYIEYFFDVMNKFSRLAISPNHKDSWHDVAGYATRIEESLNEEEKDE